MQLLALLVVMQVLISRSPAGRLPWTDASAVHLVDLLEGETLSLGDEEVDVDEAEDEHAEEDEQDPGANAYERQR